MCPIEKYINTARKNSDAIRRRRIRGVSVSLKLSSESGCFCFSPFLEAL